MHLHQCLNSLRLQCAAGKDKEYEQMTVSCFIATLPDNGDDAVAAQVAAEMDRSAKLPAEAGLPPQIVIGEDILISSWH